MEIEIPNRWLRFGLYLLLLAGPALLGSLVTPRIEPGEPLLLTPSLRRLNIYRHEAQDWVRGFEQADRDLSALLDDRPADLLVQNEAASRLYQRMLTLSQTIDRTRVPQTMETLQAQLAETAQAYLQAAVLAARWISEPSGENYQTALSARQSAGQLLERLGDNPWIEEKP